MNKKVRAKEIERGPCESEYQHSAYKYREEVLNEREREKPFYSPTLNTGADNKAFRLRFVLPVHWQGEA